MLERLLFVGILDRSDRVYCSSCCVLISLLGESASPFIDEGDSLTSLRECVRMLSLVAHAVGYEMIIGAITLLMSDACGRLRRLLLVWQTSVPAILLMPRGMQGVLPCSPSTVNTDAHNTIDA